MFSLTPEELTAIKLSLRVAAVATLVSLPIGIAVAMLIGRCRFFGRPFVNALVLLFGKQGPIGSWLYDSFGIVFAFRWTGAALACAIMGFPLLVRAIQLSVEAVDQRLEQAASTLGASRAWVFLTVTLPLITPGVIAGAVLAFARSMGEFGATITFVSNIPGETQTLPSLIYTFTQVPGGDAGALRLTVISVVISLGAVLVAEAAAHFIGRRVRAS